MKKPKLLRAPTALLRYFKAASVAISAIVSSLLAPTPLINKIHEEVFGAENGSPPHPLKSVYLANLIIHACNVR
jgi:hypothetical protein